MNADKKTYIALQIYTTEMCDAVVIDLGREGDKPEMSLKLSAAEAQAVGTSLIEGAGKVLISSLYAGNEETRH